MFCLSVTVVSSAKTAELIAMPSGLWTRVGSTNRVLDGGLDPPTRRVNFEGERGIVCNVLVKSAVTSQDPVRMQSHGFREPCVT